MAQPNQAMESIEHVPAKPTEKMLSTIAQNVAKSDFHESAYPYIVNLISGWLMEGTCMRDACKELSSDIREQHLPGPNEHPGHKNRGTAKALGLILSNTISSIYTEVQSTLHTLMLSTQVAMYAPDYLKPRISQELLQQAGLFLRAAGYELHESMIDSLLGDTGSLISKMIASRARAELSNTKLEEADLAVIASRVAISVTNTNVVHYSELARKLAAIELEHIQESLREQIFNKTLRNPMLLPGTSALEIGKTIVKPLPNQTVHPHLSYVVRVINHNCSDFLNLAEVRTRFEELPNEIQTMIFFEVFYEQLEIRPTGDASHFQPRRRHPWVTCDEPVDYRSLCLTNKSMKEKVQRHVWTEALFEVDILEDNERCLPDPVTPGGPIPLSFNGNPAPPAGMFSTINEVCLTLDLDIKPPRIPATFLKNFPLVFTGIRCVTLFVLRPESGRLYKHIINYPGNSLVPLLSSFAQKCFFNFVSSSKFFNPADSSVWDEDTPVYVQVWFAFEKITRTLLAREPVNMQAIFGSVTSASAEYLTMPGRITKQNFYDAIIEYLRVKGAEKTVTWLQAKADRLNHCYNRKK